MTNGGREPGGDGSGQRGIRLIQVEDSSVTFSELVEEFLIPATRPPGFRPLQPVVVSGCRHPFLLDDLSDRILDALSYVDSSTVDARIDSRPFSVYETGANRFGHAYRRLSQRLLGVLADSGGSIFVEDIEHVCPQLQSSLDMLADVPATAWTGAFIGYGHRGFASHWDDNDFVTLQILGSKTWRLSSGLVASPDAGFERYVEHGADALEVTLTPGGALAIPRGVVHSTRVDEGPSIHIMVARRLPTIADVLIRRVREAAHANVALRRDHLCADDDQIREALSSLGDLARLLGP